MKAISTILALALLLVQPAFATNDKDECSVRSLAGRWMFATDIGHRALPPGGDITAIGIFHLDRHGIVDGKFDATIEDLRFLPDVLFSGTLVVNADCTGTLTFVTTLGTSRTDSIIVLGPGRIRGMSQDISNLWTYDMRRRDNCILINALCAAPARTAALERSQRLDGSTD